MEIVNLKTGEVASSTKWNPSAIAEVIITYEDGSSNSDFAKDWICTCHKLPLSEDSHGFHLVLCSLNVEKENE